MNGLSPKIPLVYDSLDGPYSLNKNMTETAKQNLKMLLLTNPGERIMVPGFGVGLRSYIFSIDNNNTRKALSSKIYEQIQRFMPYITVQELIFSPVGSNDNNTLFISIKYSIDGLSINDELNIEL